MRIELDGVEVLAAALRVKSETDFKAVCKRAVMLLRNNARARTPVQTGKLRNSLRASMPSGDTTGEVGYTREYAPMWNTDIERFPADLCRGSIT